MNGKTELNCLLFFTQNFTFPWRGGNEFVRREDPVELKLTHNFYFIIRPLLTHNATRALIIKAYGKLWLGQPRRKTNLRYFYKNYIKEHNPKIIYYKSMIH